MLGVVVGVGLDCGAVLGFPVTRQQRLEVVQDFRLARTAKKTQSAMTTKSMTSVQTVRGHQKKRITRTATGQKCFGLLSPIINRLDARTINV